MKNKKDINTIFSLYFPQEQLRKIQKATIMIVGCGGLGSNVANILIRTGFLNIIIIDYDIVELKNLNRQHYYPSDIGKPKVDVLRKQLLKINPKAKIKTIKAMIEEKKFKDIINRFKPDIIVEAVDKERAKMIIFETALKLKKQIIMASGVAGYGDVEKIKVIRRKNYTIIGDLISRCDYSESSKKEGVEGKLYKMPLAPKVIAVAAMQADEVLRRTIGGAYEEKRET